ncbi:hypothetical protein PRIPAC_75235 [Pristionchus pacificus]|uniref:ADP ribosylation factor n=1 Tax=Pristionchus pacificus TaxID=54126 RepID=A0A2A6C871_PRIPA|nr:hypothetical protein PRIPAC_75235 [Pristionchus pacificus]|eukprot:PDM74221.1 ADP ribosylation factor [Pristionchus pacificus]
MGSVYSRVCGPPRKRLNVLMSGLSASGKTSIQCRLRFGIFPTEICSYVSAFFCTISEDIEINSSSLSIFLHDLGASAKMREQHVRWWRDVAALIYVVDCSDEDRLEEARIELHEHLSDANMKDKNLLVIISKRDLPNALSDEMLVDRLNLNVIKGREWKIQSTSAKTGEGISEVAAWLEQLGDS